MPITEKQRAERKNHLGGSDIALLMDFSPYGNKYDLWLLKTGRVEPKERTQDYITAGNLLEKPIIDWLWNFLDCDSIITNPEAMERKVDGLPIVVHMDGIVESTGVPVESKSEGVDHPILLPWGEAGSDEVPEHVCLQAHAHMMATDREICHVPTFLGGRGFGYFFVKRDNKIVELIKRQAIDFWENHVLKDVPPENIAPSLAMAKRIRSVEGEAVTLADEIIQSWLDAKEVAKEANNRVKFHQAEILALLDGVEMGTCSLGDITNFKQTRRGIDAKALKADLPEIHEKYYQTGEPYPVMRLKKRK